MKSSIELLAPAGTVETFLAALDGGADAVYVGAPGFNARNLARDLSLEEIGAMIRHCRTLGKKLYLAFNSLLFERELGDVLATLAILEDLQPDALIVQDYALIELVRKYFPRLKLHASTLMTATSSLAARFLGSLGCERVVLARELTLKEIETIGARSEGVELEVFVHGAMCYSYSGLCLFSSYLGGKSGLRGRCVQPCRRAYRNAGKNTKGQGVTAGGKYLFSMNDLSGLEVVPDLKKLGVASLKIEGRLRTAHYINSVVHAYRLVIDAAEEEFAEVLSKAQLLIENSMSRRTSSGYFFSPQPPEAITPYHSGNLGIHLGRFSVVKEAGGLPVCRFVLKAGLQVGDRLRLHNDTSGERVAFRLKSLYVGSALQQQAEAGARVSIALPDQFQAGSVGQVDVYKTDNAPDSVSRRSVHLPTDEVAKELGRNKAKRLKRVESLKPQLWGIDREGKEGGPATVGDADGPGKGRKQAGRKGLELWLKLDSCRILYDRQLPQSFSRYIITCSAENVREAGKVRSFFGKQARDVIWSLPAVILENELEQYYKRVVAIGRNGFRNFQLGHFSQTALFAGDSARLSGDYTLNILNSRALLVAAELGLEFVQASIESDRMALADLIDGRRRLQKVLAAPASQEKIHLPLVGLTVFGAPALYTARLGAEHFRYEQEILSPKDESFVILKKEGGVQTYPIKPFSLLPYLGELQEMGLNYGVVDISGRTFSRKELAELVERLGNTRRYAKLPTFNYLGQLD